MRFNHDEKNTLRYDFLIVDEASMIDAFLAHAIFKALPYYTHVIFIGDIDQLPAVGAGDFLNDLIKSKKIPIIRLNFIFRQAHNSLIILNAHKINKGEFPLLQAPDAKKDFIYIKEDKPEELKNHLKKIFHAILPRFKIPQDKAIVLCPMHRGSAGTQTINLELQNMLNPANNETKIMYAGTSFKIGDPVMQIRNNYDKQVFNGDLGYITSIDLKEQKLTISYEGTPVSYEFDELSELVLAYSVSIHKSQGSEYPAVIVPLFMQHYTLLQRNLVYTAITRAKKLCIVIGQAKALAIAIHKNKDLKRQTFLTDFLISDLVAR